MSAPEPQSPIGDRLRPGHRGGSGIAPVTIAERRVSVCQLTAGKGRVDAVKAAAQQAFALALPGPNRVADGRGATAIWIAPDTWLIVRERGGTDLTEELATVLRAVAAVVDQSAGKTVLRISGKRARDVLAKACRVDLHPRVFAPGHAAVTPLGHVNAVVVAIDAAPTFDLIVGSTLARDVFEWLCVSAAEFGYEVAG